MIDAEDGWTDRDREIYELILNSHRPMILVINKMDLQPAKLIASLPSSFKEPQIVQTAAALSQGIDRLELAILNSVHKDALSSANMDIAINQRQKANLLTATQALERVIGAIASQLPLDFWTIDLRDAIHALGEITGEEIIESVLETIFSKFCIGK